MVDKGLTKEYLDKSLKELRVGMTKELKEHVTKEIEKVGYMTAKGFEDVPGMYAYKEEIEKLKRDNRIIKQALNLPL